LIAAFNSRDLDDVLSLMDPEVDFFAPKTAHSVGRNVSYQGHDGVRQYFDDVAEVWSRLEFAPRECLSKNSHVVTLGTVIGERDGEPFEDKVAWAWKLRDGKFVWGRVYEDPDQALEDAGLI
jgi:ketosteroid isomerase-like protein